MIGNKKKTRKYCAIFRKYLDLSLHQMYWLCTMFLEEYEYTRKLENIFMDSNKHRYGKFINNIDDSPLYQFYESNIDRVKYFWKIKEVI